MMSGNLNMGNNKIINLTDPTDNTEAANEAYIDKNFLKLSGGHITGEVTKDHQSFTNRKSLINYAEMQFWFVSKDSPYAGRRFNMVNHKTINLGDPADDRDAINKQFLEQEVQKSYIKPNHYNDEFKYLIANKLEWTDLLGDSFPFLKLIIYILMRATIINIIIKFYSQPLKRIKKVDTHGNRDTMFST